MLSHRNVCKILLAVFAIAASSGLLGFAGPAAAATVTTINAGNGAYLAGTVTVSNNGSSVTVTYETVSGDTPTRDWKLAETHLDVQCDPSGFPTTGGGNPQPGQFAYTTEHDPPVDSFSYTVQAPEGCAVACLDSIVLAAHAALIAIDPATGQQIGEETGWGDGTRFCPVRMPGGGGGGGGCGNWGTWFEAPLGGAVVKAASVRWRSFANTSSSELLVGRGSLTNAPNLTEAHYIWLRPGTYDVTFTYDRNALTLVATIAPGGASVTYQLSQPLAQMDSFDVALTDRDRNSQVDISNVKLDGMPVGSFVGDGTRHVYGFPSNLLDDGFVFTGTISISGNFSNTAELSKVEIAVGRCLAN